MLGCFKADVMDASHSFFENEMFERSSDATYITLIPKKKGAKELKTLDQLAW